MGDSIIDVSREFFHALVKPILEREFPEETAETAFGVFGYGSEALGMDDDYSRDHHWGLRIDALMPDEVFQSRREAIMQVLSDNLPSSFQGHSLREGHVPGKGLAPDSLPGFLMRTIGMDHAPRTDTEWLSIPEEDIIHIINGELWHDPAGHFTAIRRTFQSYYPEPVRRRRIAHWCRYFSGMGSYALKRAILRNNDFYAATAFAKAIRWGVQLAFLLDRQYFPYDKWLMAYFERLPRLAAPLCPIVEEAVSLATPWERKLALLDDMADILDATMVADGLIQPHPKFTGSPTSGYRLLEHAYAELIQSAPAEIKAVVPVWDQVYLEQFHSGYVNSIDLHTWDEILNLSAED
ncbi:MAG TPA: hypothetical protein DEP84_12370 [Chloroflexi bacterium]|nr:hypothetical protein [Chloroflexota bacterium]